MNSKSSMWVAVLTFTGLVLGVLMMAAPNREARAEMINAQASFTLITSGAPGADEALTVIDKTAQKMIIYHLNGNSFEVISSFNYGR